MLLRAFRLYSMFNFRMFNKNDKHLKFLQPRTQDEDVINTALMVTDKGILAQFQQQSDNEDNENDDVKTITDEPL